MSTAGYEDIMRHGSTTFFNSSLFFPARVRGDVMTLYAFVRTADDYVDATPQDRTGFLAFRDQYHLAAKGSSVGDAVVSDFVELSRRCAFESEWIENFLRAMEQDLWKREYSTLSETEEYMRGSAEAVGMMMARILSLADDSLPCAALLGKAFQYLNFIRDVREDLEMGRVYLPTDEIAAAGLPELSLAAVGRDPEGFNRLIRRQLERYGLWRREAAKGYRHIPRRYLIAIKTAADVFDLTAAKIDRNPAVVLDRKVKPSRQRVLLKGFWNLVTTGNWAWRFS